MCQTPLRHCSGKGAALAPLHLPGPPEGGPCVSVCYCSHCTHRLLHLHVAHGGVRGGFGPVRQLLVAPSLGIQQVGERTQLEVVSICKKHKAAKIGKGNLQVTGSLAAQRSMFIQRQLTS